MRFLTVKSITALLFVFLPGKNEDFAKLGSCNGWLRRQVRLRENYAYEFSLDLQLSQGDVCVSLLDRHKQLLLKLDSLSPAGRLEINARDRYYLRWEFKGASGKCRLHWEKSALQSVPAALSL